MYDIVSAIIVEQMELGKEAQLVTVADISVVFVHWPEKSVFFSAATSIETVSQMRCEDISSSGHVSCQVIADVLDSAVVIRPYRNSVPYHMQVYDQTYNQDQ
jgi:hypothetical protein